MRKHIASSGRAAGLCPLASQRFWRWFGLSLRGAAALALLAGAVARGEEETGVLICNKSATFLAPGDGGSGRHFAPEPEVRMLHLTLDVTPDFKAFSVAGQATLQFKVLRRPVSELRLDAVRLKVTSVTATEKLAGWQATDDHLILTFAKPLKPEQAAGVTIAYSAEPKEGLYFRTPEQGYKPGDTHLFSQGEESEARHWYPCFDSPNVKFTSEVTCHVPTGMTVISNGRLVEQKKDAAGGLTAFHWSQEKPHANYLITLVAGYLSQLEGRHGKVPLTFYTPVSEAGEAATSFRHTDDIMKFLEQEIGVPYPWVKYAQVCVNDFVAGGMENTSATTLTDSTLFTDASENLHDSDALVAHEMAHQWFGDLVTCKDWCHTWLNEGFATYYEALYRGHRQGRDAMLLEFQQSARQITSMGEDTTPIVRRVYNQPRDMFNYLAYPKGSWVLRMLRADLGDDLFHRSIKTYLERFQYGSVGTEDLRGVIEEISGRSFDQFFDQWLYHGHFPEIEAAYSWDESAKLAKLAIKQTQKLSDNVQLFRVPLKVRFKGKFGMTERVMTVAQAEENFTYKLASAPETVRLDPDCELLAKLTFNLPNAMLLAQLDDKRDVLGRLMAVEQLARQSGQQTVAKLAKTLAEDDFYGVRTEAVNALRGNHSDAALAALLAQTHQTDARVRNQVLNALGGFYTDSAYAAERQTLEQEKNPEIVAVAIRNVGAYMRPEVHDLLLKYLDSTSYHHQLADAAIAAMRSQGDPDYVAPLLQHLERREAAFTPFGFSQALGTLAWLARDQDKKDDVREFLLRYVNHKRRVIQTASLNALGTLGDPKATGALETLASTSKDNPAQGAAERALTQLRSGRRSGDEPRSLRQEVLDLQKANRELRKDLDEIKKQLEAKPAAAQAAPAAKTTPVKPATPPAKPTELKSPKTT